MRLGHDLPISVKDRRISAFLEDFFSRNFAYAKFRENKTLAKIFKFTVFWFQNVCNTLKQMSLDNFTGSRRLWLGLNMTIAVDWDVGTKWQ